MNIKNIMSSAGLVTSLLLSASSQALVMSDSTGFVFGDLLTFDTIADGDVVIEKTSKSYNLSRFDPSLGILTSVTLGMKSKWVLSGQLGVKGRIRPPFEKPALPDFRASNFDHDGFEGQFDDEHENEDKYRYGGEGAAAIGMDVALTGISGSIDYFDSLTNSCVSSFLGCIDIDATSGSFDITLPPLISDLGFFIGTNPLEMLLTHSSFANLDECEGSCVQNASSGWGGKLYVEYTYDEKSVPEPSILGLLGLGLLGVSGASAFKRRRG